MTSMESSTANETILYVKILNKNAKLPERQTSGSAGFDIFSLESGIIKPGLQFGSLISTGIAIKLPLGTYGRMASRSGLSVKNGIEVGAGTIDQDYRGELFILLRNHSDKLFKFKKHTRIAQLIITPALTPNIIEVVEFTDDDKNERKTKGFGSTGLM